jgi:CRISPR-associated endoribonuclease Cas6
MRVTRLGFVLKVLDPLYLPEFKGSAFRGLFGHALKKTVCVVNALECQNCLLHSKCAYPYIFETRNERSEAVAHPFVFEPPLTSRRVFPDREIFTVFLNLFGHAHDFIPYIIFAFREMGKRGLGARRSRFYVQSVFSETEKGREPVFDHKTDILSPHISSVDLTEKMPVNSANKQITFNFITPTAIKKDGQINLNPGFETIIKALIRRNQALSHYHNGTDVPRDFTDLLEMLKSVNLVSSELEPMFWERYSSRQKKTIGFDGFVGAVRFEGELQPFMELINLGRYFHIGRGTVFGMGKYEVER